MTLDFYQIYFKNEQLIELYPFSTPHKNEDCTDYFENSVIQTLVPKSEADYISVCSWRLKEKREMGSCPIILGDTSLSEAKILGQDADIMNLRPFRGGHQALTMAENWHFPNWEPCIKELKKFIKVPQEISNPIYENHFVARKEIYHDYVLNTLRPCMAFIADRPNIFGLDSGYLRKLKREPERIKDYQEKTGRKDWPMTPFILERLFSIWIEGKGYKIVNL
jgi:hypothetical protein